MNHFSSFLFAWIFSTRLENVLEQLRPSLERMENDLFP